MGLFSCFRAGQPLDKLPQDEINFISVSEEDGLEEGARLSKFDSASSQPSSALAKRCWGLPPREGSPEELVKSFEDRCATELHGRPSLIHRLLRKQYGACTRSRRQAPCLR